MGMLVHVFRGGLDCNLNRFKGARSICVVNVEGPFSPGKDTPAATLVKRGREWVVVPVEEPKEGHTPYMDGGTYAATSDSRWFQAVKTTAAIPVHDRSETWELAAALSR